MSGMITKGILQPPAGSLSLAIVGTGVVMQPGRKLSYKSDGIAEGSVKFRCAIGNVGGLPALGSPHPDNPTLLCHHIEQTSEELGLVVAECFYHGIVATYGQLSRPLIDYPGGTDTLPIQLHPDFATFAGTPLNPNNGALWVTPGTEKKTTDNSKAEFFGFIDPSNAGFFGVEHYFVNRPLVSRTYWTKVTPTLSHSMKIVTSIPGFNNPPGITNWLMLDSPYREAAGIFQVTEQYKGSPAPGWSTAIYPQT